MRRHLRLTAALTANLGLFFAPTAANAAEAFTGLGSSQTAQSGPIAKKQDARQAQRRLAFLAGVETAQRSDCHLPEDEIEILTSASGVEFVRTPESCFHNLRGYRFDSKYVEVDGLQMHYLDDGPTTGPVVLMLHGEPTWSYLYRDMIPQLSSMGYRVIVPNLIGMGKSVKPIDPNLHQIDQHVQWLRTLMATLNLTDVNLVLHDWGGQIGLRVAGSIPEQTDRIVALNTDFSFYYPGQNPFQQPSFEVDDALTDVDAKSFLQSRSEDPVVAYQQLIYYASSHPDLTASEFVEAGSAKVLFEGELAAYNAPYPSQIYKAAIRAFPAMIVGEELQSHSAWNTLGTYRNPFLFLAGEFDPNQGSVENQDKWINYVPGAEGYNHRRYKAGHSIQEDSGLAVARQIGRFIANAPTGKTPVGGGPAFNNRTCELILVKDFNPPNNGEVWGTSGLNGCPQEEWDALDLEALAVEFNVVEIRPNGPFYPVADNLVDNSVLNGKQSSQPSNGDPTGGGPSQIEIRNYGGVEMRLLATSSVNDGPAEESERFGASITFRTNTWIYAPGRRIFELQDPEGKRYVMQTRSNQIDPDLSYEDLETLGDRLTPPEGWTYRSYVTEQQFLVPTDNGEATVLEDNFLNTYQQIPTTTTQQVPPAP